MTLRFYRGGPVAVVDDVYGVTDGGAYGCIIANGVGAVIPASTYVDADPRVSQMWYIDVGINYTALLPIEE